MEVAKATAHYLKPACKRVGIGGSLRRRKEMVKDVELIVVPKLFAKSRDLFGNPDDEEDRLEESIKEANRVEYPWLDFWSDPKTGEVRDGPKYKKLIDTKTGVPIDLFIVRPPAQWGTIFMLRTGSASWNKRFIARLDELGLKMRDGRIIGDRGALDTEEEIDVFKAAKVKWKEPKDRK
jgi:DNA polymerase/3'-5' exonuclease PolX